MRAIDASARMDGVSVASGLSFMMVLEKQHLRMVSNFYAKKTAFNICCVEYAVRVWGMSRLEKGLMSRRERQIMDILYRLGQGSAKEVLENLPDPPSYSAVRALMVTLEGKGMVKHSKESRRYIYSPVIAEKRARKSAISNLLSTFFDGKPEKLVAALLDSDDMKLEKKEISKIRSALED